MRRRFVLVAAFAFLAVSAGCTAFGSDAVNPDDLQRNVSYDWETSANATITVKGSSYEAVYRVRNTTRFEAFRFHRLNNKRPIDLVGVKFRFPNGTVVDADAMEFHKRKTHAVIVTPAENGTLAFSAPKNGKRVRLAKLVAGTHEVILPPNAQVKYPLLGRVVPGGYETRTVEGRVHVVWESVRGKRLIVEYYLTRDLLLFGGLFVIAVGAAIGGVVYFFFRIKSLKRRRESVDIDVESDDSGRF